VNGERGSASPSFDLAVLGDPLAYTRSPDLHVAGLRAVGLEGRSEALRTPAAALAPTLDALAARGVRGVNLTYPLKEAVIPHLDRVSDAARRARSVNTVGFGPDGRWGDTTDGPGFLDFLRALGRDPARERVVLLGAGGASRSLAMALDEAGATQAVSARRPAVAAAAWEDLPRVARLQWRSTGEARALAAATLVVNGTPLGGAEAPAALDRIARPALIVDLVYGPGVTPWVRDARADGREAFDGLGLLVHQARRSLALWTGRDVPLEPLAAAVGWPR
jgi:shikimate dehydrogenase